MRETPGPLAPSGRPAPRIRQPQSESGWAVGHILLTGLVADDPRDGLLAAGPGLDESDDADGALSQVAPAPHSTPT